MSNRVKSGHCILQWFLLTRHAVNSFYIHCSLQLKYKTRILYVAVSRKQQIRCMYITKKAAVWAHSPSLKLPPNLPCAQIVKGSKCLVGLRRLHINWHQTCTWFIKTFSEKLLQQMTASLAHTCGTSAGCCACYLQCSVKTNSNQTFRELINVLHSTA